MDCKKSKIQNAIYFFYNYSFKFDVTALYKRQPLHLLQLIHISICLLPKPLFSECPHCVSQFCPNPDQSPARQPLDTNWSYRKLKEISEDGPLVSWCGAQRGSKKKIRSKSIIFLRKQ